MDSRRSDPRPRQTGGASYPHGAQEGHMALPAQARLPPPTLRPSQSSSPPVERMFICARKVLEGRKNDLKPFVAIQRFRLPPGKGAARQLEPSLAWRAATYVVKRRQGVTKRRGKPRDASRPVARGGTTTVARTVATGSGWWNQRPAGARGDLDGQVGASRERAEAIAVDSV